MRASVINRKFSIGIGPLVGVFPRHMRFLRINSAHLHFATTTNLVGVGPSSDNVRTCIGSFDSKRGQYDFSGLGTSGCYPLTMTMDMKVRRTFTGDECDGNGLVESLGFTTAAMMRWLFASSWGESDSQLLAINRNGMVALAVASDEAKAYVRQELHRITCNNVSILAIPGTAPIVKLVENNAQLVPVLASTVSFLVLISALFIFIYRRHRRRMREMQELIRELSPEQALLVGKFMAEDRLKVWRVRYDDIDMGRKVAGGSRGQVYFAVWKGTPCAMKRLDVGHIDEEGMRRFRGEVELLQVRLMVYSLQVPIGIDIQYSVYHGTN